MTWFVCCVYCQWLCWHHASHVLLAGTVDGEMWMWLVPQGNTRTFPSYGSASLCGAFLHDGNKKIRYLPLHWSLMPLSGKNDNTQAKHLIPCSPSGNTSSAISRPLLNIGLYWYSPALPAWCYCSPSCPWVAILFFWLPASHQFCAWHDLCKPIAYSWLSQRYLQLLSVPKSAK